MSTILTKICEVKKNEWEHKLYAALWAYRTAFKTSTGQTLFQLAYGMEAVMPAEYVLPSLRIALEEILGDEESHKGRFASLEKLSEARQMAIHAMMVEKMRRKAWYDRVVIRNKGLNDGDSTLLYGTKKHKGKSKIMGNGPYLVHHINENGVV